MTTARLLREIKQFINAFIQCKNIKNMHTCFPFKIFDLSYLISFTVCEDTNSNLEKINDIQLLTIINNLIISTIYSDEQSLEVDNFIYLLNNSLPIKMIIKMWKVEDAIQLDIETAKKHESLFRDSMENKLYNIIKDSKSLTLSEITKKTRWIPSPVYRRELLQNLKNKNLITINSIKESGKKYTTIFSVKD